MDRFGLLCRNIYEKKKITQRELAAAMDLSLGTCNHLIRDALADGLIALDPQTGEYSLLKKGVELLQKYRVNSAVILAAGFGSRFVPLTFETPKGLLEVFGERMIERQINQLHEAGIMDITIVVGYLKEKFEYLIDKFGVKLLYNPEYHNKNTLTTVYRARDCFKGKNTYLLSSDNWIRENMYHTYECGAWYSSVYMEGATSEWCLEASKKGLLTGVAVGGSDSWVMYGPVYFSREFSEEFFPVLEKYYETPGTEQMYWEQVLADLLNGTAGEHVPSMAKYPAPKMYINRQPENQVYEFENLEELRVFDEKYRNNSNNAAMELVAEVLHIPESEVTDLKCLKTGMTNKSFLFKARERSYICRIPGPGTDLLINRAQEKAVYDKLALVITDEQHRFGVNQRRALSMKGDNPHVLVMSATPIPRTLAIIVYGDLDISIIDTLPAERLPIKNCVVGTNYRENAYKFIAGQVKEGRQAYVICPMVEESENVDAENVVEYAEKLKAALPPQIRVEYLHGKMKANQKEEIMARFAARETDVLVSTTVIEVGVNVPNATVMMVENADRFGLAQLHQLRGRVGRGKYQSYCIFVSGSDTAKAKDRLGILNQTNDGFKIAEEDLKQRGPGDFFGVRQSGDLRFKIGDIFSDSKVLKEAADAAGAVLAKDELLSSEENVYLKTKVEEYTKECLENINL